VVRKHRNYDACLIREEELEMWLFRSFGSNHRSNTKLALRSHCTVLYSLLKLLSI